MTVKVIKVPRVVTGKWIARLIKRSHLKWNNNTLWDEGDNSFCALGIIARHAGVIPKAIASWGEGTRNLSGREGIPTINDDCQTKRQVVCAFWRDHGQDEFEVGPWVDSLLDYQHRTGKENM